MFDIKQYKSELKTLCDFTEIYDQFRLVDPDTAKVYMLKDGRAILADSEPCYKIWNRDSPCENCISRRTCYNHAQYMKLEYLNGNVLMIVSKPIVIENQLLSLELATDVTKSMVVQDQFNHCNDQIGIAELIEKVNRLSVSDSFTGLYNNEYIKDKIRNLADNSKMHPFTILILDIDQFKQVNDEHGHLVGDVVIQTISAILSDFFNLSGYYVGRMGGDEYCVVLENCELSEAEYYAESIAKKIANHRYQGIELSFTVEVSIGVGEFIPGEEPYTFIGRVDNSLYEVKRIKREKQNSIKIGMSEAVLNE